MVSVLYQPIFAWNVPLVFLIFLKRSLVFHILLLSSISLHWLLRKAFLSLLALLWNSIQMDISFIFSFAFSFFSQLFVSPPQTTILPFCISFSWGWSWSLPPVQCHEPPSIVLQALCVSDLIPWIYCYFHCIIVSDLPGEISITSDMQMTPALWQKVKRN